MPLGTKWIIELKTTIPIGDKFIESVIIDGLGVNEDDGGNITDNIKIICIKELSVAEYNKYDESVKKWRKDHGITK